MEQENKPHILYIEDSRAAARLFQLRLEAAGFDVDWAANGEEGLRMCESNQYDLIAVDFKMPRLNGLEVLQILAERGNQAPVIMITGQDDIRIAVEAMKLGASDFLLKDSESSYLALLPTVVMRVLEQSRIQRERQVALNQLKEHNQRLALLNQTTQLLTATLDLNEVRSQLVELLTQVIRTEGSSVWLWDPESPGELICDAIFSRGQHMRQDQLRLRAGQGIAGWVARHGETVVVSNAEVDPRFSDSIDHYLNFSTRSLLTVPLRTRNRIIGVLQLVNKIDGEFNAQDHALAETLAGAAAIAIENARLVEELRQRGEELVVHNDELDAFAHTVAHDLKNPIALIIGFADMLRETFETMPNHEIREQLDAILEFGQKMNGIVEALLLLAGVREQKAVDVDYLDMGTIIYEATRRLEDIRDRTGAVIEMPETWPDALGYGPWVEEVWFNYLSNALKYGGRPPRLKLGYEVLAHQMIKFWVRDNGDGFMLDDSHALFKPLARARAHDRERGHGLGLSIVRRIVERLGGEVGAVSEVGVGSEFYFTLPAAPPESNTA